METVNGFSSSTTSDLKFGTPSTSADITPVSSPLLLDPVVISPPPTPASSAGVTAGMLTPNTNGALNPFFPPVQSPSSQPSIGFVLILLAVKILLF